MIKTTRKPFRINRLSYLHFLVGLAVLFLGSATLTAADPINFGFHKRVFKDDSGEHRYVVYVPLGYTPEKKSPVVLFLHGGGERGTDGVKQSHIGLGAAIQKIYKTYPYITVFPQCEDEKGPILSAWSADHADGKRAMKILEEVEKEFSTDGSNRFLTGWSMGAYGVWSLAAAHPDHWKAVIPLSGGGNPKSAAKIKDIPIWAFHGADDDVVRIEESEEMVQALKAAKGKFLFTSIPNEKHNTWETVYIQPELYKWMENPTVEKTPEIKFETRIDKPSVTTATTIAPFVSSVDIRDAISLRIGNKVLSAISKDLPSMLPSNALTGSIPDITDSTTASGRTFSVRFSSISYSGQISGAAIKAYTNERINIQVGLSNVRLNIGRTYVNGKRRSAVAGPITISFGHVSPVWLSFDITPYIAGNQVKLRHVGTYFRIPPGNFSVSAPAGVSVSGLGMTSERVSSSLVQGLYGNRSRIESEISAVIPNILPQLEKELDFSKATSLLEDFWPLPVYKPQVRVWPSNISVDSTGISLKMGISAQGIIPLEAGTPARVVQIKQGAIPAQDHFQLGFAPQIIQEMTQLLVDEKISHIHLSDIPGKKFDKFSDPEVMGKIIPELKKFGKTPKIWAEFFMESSLAINPVAKANSASVSLVSQVKEEQKQADKKQTDPKQTDQPEKKAEIKAEKKPSSKEKTDPEKKAETKKEDSPKGETDKKTEKPEPISKTLFSYSIPKAVILISVASNEKPGERKTIARFELNLSQKSDISLLQPEYSKRALQINWEGDPEIEFKGGFVKDYKAENPEIKLGALKNLFMEGWRDWTDGSGSKEFELKDFVFGNSSFRLNEITWAGPFLIAELNAPGVRIKNKTDKPLIYEMKYFTSGWGGPYTLKPGKSHFFDVTRPLEYRRREQGQIVEHYTLPVGSNSEFRILKGKDKPGMYSAVAK